MMKGFKIVAVVASLCPVFVSAQTIEQPLPGIPGGTHAHALNICTCSAL